MPGIPRSFWLFFVFGDVAGACLRACSGKDWSGRGARVFYGVKNTGREVSGAKAAESLGEQKGFLRTPPEMSDFFYF